jgi:hypothetical protein
MGAHGCEGNFRSINRHNVHRQHLINNVQIKMG